MRKLKTNHKNNEITLFKELFDEYFQSMVTYAYRYVNDWQTAEDIAQNVFMALWIKKESIDFEKPIKPYLYKAIYNKSINHLNSVLIQRRTDVPETTDILLNREILDYNQYDTLLLKEIKGEIDSFVDTLPPQCRKVFLLSREEHLRNKEIAEKLHISEKAVEKHISKALNEIRNHLIKLDMIPFYILLLLPSQMDS